MAPNRDLARQQRRRGAASRHGQVVDFGLKIPNLTSAGTSKNTRTTPGRPAAAATTTKTPRSSSRSTMSSKGSTRKRAALDETPGNQGASTSIKRQKLSRPPLVSGQNTSARKTRDNDLYSLQEEGLDELGDELVEKLSASTSEQDELGDAERQESFGANNIEYAAPRSTKSTRQSARFLTVPAQMVDESPADAPGSGQRVEERVALVESLVRLSDTLKIVRQPSAVPKTQAKTPAGPKVRGRSENARSSVTVAADQIELSASISTFKTPRTARGRSHPKLRKASPELISSAPSSSARPGIEADDEMDDLSPGTGNTSKISSAAGPPEENEMDELSPEQSRISTLSSNEAIMANQIEDREVAIQLTQRKKKSLRPSTRSMRPEEVDEQVEELLEDPKFDTTQQSEPPTVQTDRSNGITLTAPTRERKQQRDPSAATRASPAIQRQPKTKPRTRNKPRTQARGKESVFIPVHRLTLPSIIADDADSDADPIAGNIPFHNRSSVNVIDVLAEFCEETIDSSLTTLEEGGQNAQDVSTRREYRTKLRAVEAFQEEMRTRLLEHTAILDATYTLKKRVKASQREIQHLRGEVLRIRAEREAVTLQADAVRMRFAKESSDANDHHALNTTLHDIQLLIEQTPSESDATLEPPRLLGTIDDVARRVSSIAPGGGTLGNLKEYNSWLERVAFVLEGRD